MPNPFVVCRHLELTKTLSSLNEQNKYFDQHERGTDCCILGPEDELLAPGENNDAQCIPPTLDLSLFGTRDCTKAADIAFSSCFQAAEKCFPGSEYFLLPKHNIQGTVLPVLSLS
jgi:hypothetical protein